MQIYDAAFRHVKTLHPGNASSPSSFVYRVIPWNKDSLLIATDEGMFMYHKFNFGYKSVTQPHLLNAADDGLIPLYYFEASDGSLWLSGGRFGGVLVVDASRENARRFAAGTGAADFPLGHATGFQEDAKANIWMINVNNGITKWNSTTLQFDTVFTKLDQRDSSLNHISGFVIDSNQHHWYFVNHTGLFTRKSLSDSLVQVLQVSDGALSDALSLFYTDEHQLWIYLRNGLMVYDIQTGGSRYFSYGKISGTPVPWATRLEMDKQTDRLFLGCLNRILEIKSPVSFHTNDNPILFRGMTVPGSRSRLDFSNTLRLEPDENDISIDFATVDYDQLSIPNYEYRLIHNGDNSNWVMIEGQSSLNFNKLVRGNYTLQVRKMGLNRLESDNYASLSFLVKPTFIETNFFKILIVLLLVALMYAFYRLRISQLLRENLIRNRISSDLHDDLGARITSLALLGEIIDKNEQDKSVRNQYLQKMKEELKLASEALDDIVWNEKTMDESASEMVSRMRRFAADLLEPTSIQLQFSAASFSRWQKLNKEKRRDIFLAYKEVLNNVLKHSGADKLIIEISSSGNRFNLSIQDNGIGMPEKPDTNRNGLRIIKSRVEKWKGKLNYIAGSGGGVQVHLVIPFDNLSLKWSRFR